MTAYHAGQLVLAAAIVAVVAERARVLLFEAPLDTMPYLRAIAAAIEERDRPHLEALVAAGRPGWVARVAARARGLDGDDPVDELLAELRYRALQRLGALRALASVATAAGFLGAIVELIWLLEGDHGLLGLMAGLPERVALQGAMLSMAIGVASSVLAFVALATFRRAAVALLRDVDRAAVELEQAPSAP